jgi:hypothetical protein
MEKDRQLIANMHRELGFALASLQRAVKDRRILPAVQGQINSASMNFKRFLFNFNQLIEKDLENEYLLKIKQIIHQIQFLNVKDISRIAQIQNLLQKFEASHKKTIIPVKVRK